MDRLLKKLRSSVQPHHILIVIGVVFGFIILSALLGGRSGSSPDTDA
jgi:type II secretory pathway component PulF